MYNFEVNYSAMLIHKNREQELIAQAENARQANTLREKIVHRARRVVSKNNPVR